MLASEIPLSKTLLSYRVAELSSVFTRPKIARIAGINPWPPATRLTGSNPRLLLVDLTDVSRKFQLSAPIVS